MAIVPERIRRPQRHLIKYDGRMPHRRIQDAMMRLFGLKISPATIFDLARRVSDAVQSEYEAILNKKTLLRSSETLYGNWREKRFGTG